MRALYPLLSRKDLFTSQLIDFTEWAESFTFSTHQDEATESFNLDVPLHYQRFTHLS